MIKPLKILFLICFCLINVTCNKKTNNNPPSELNLVFPSENLLCTNNIITFDWSEAVNFENDEVEYTITIAKDKSLDNIIENRTLKESEITLTLEYGTPYYWKVDALNTNNNTGISSKTFAFYTQGESIQNYAPFAAELITPENNETITLETVFLSWTAEDINTTDILTYELFFGENDNLVLINDNLISKNFQINVSKGKRYSWKVDVKDSNGGKSIGEIWSFTVSE